MTNLKRKASNYQSLVKAIQFAHQEMKSRAVSAVNQALVLRNWIIGAYIVEYKQGGTDRAKYGTRLLERLATDLEKRQLKGLDPRGLRDCRTCYRFYPQIRGSLTPELTQLPSKASIPTPLSVERLLCLSWTKLAEIVHIDDPWKRAFYENECLGGNWSVRQLQRQIESLLYERTGLSKNKKAVIERGRKQASKAPKESMDDIIRDPYVLEFAGLAERFEYSENDLESALLNHLQRFLLELGTGFCFEARQFRITTNNRHHRVDLVFYNRRLRCHLLIDLKIRAFRHADAGQMNFYLNWFKSNMADKNDNPPVGILLCTGKDHTDVRVCDGRDGQQAVCFPLPHQPSFGRTVESICGSRSIPL